MKHLLPFLLVIVLLSCSKDNAPSLPVSIDKQMTEIHYDGKYQFHLTRGNDAVDATSFLWTSSEPFVGTVDANGLFTAKHIGETVITATAKDNSTILKSPISIRPYSTAWTEPYVGFGVTKQIVKSNEKRTLLVEDATSIFYKGESSNVRYVLYSFTNGNYSGSLVALDNTSAMAKEAATFIKERYDYIQSGNNTYIFTDNNSLAVGITVDNTLGLAVGYIPYKKGGRIGVESNEIVQDRIVELKNRAISSKLK